MGALMVQKKDSRNGLTIGAEGNDALCLSPPRAPLFLFLPVSIAADEPFQIDGFFRRFARDHPVLFVASARCPALPLCPSSVCLSSSRATALSSWSLVHYVHSNPQAAFTRISWFIG